MDKGSMSRRQFLKVAGVAGATVSLGAGLGAGPPRGSQGSDGSSH